MALEGDEALRRQAMIRGALEDDIRLFGKKYEALRFRASSRARDRHRAINWLWVGEPLDDVTIDM